MTSYLERPAREAMRPGAHPLAALLNDMFHDVAGVRDARSHRTWSSSDAPLAPALDIQELPAEFLVTCDLPGVDAGDISVQIENDVVTLRAERKAEYRDVKEGYRYSERTFGSYERAFRLPKSVDPSRVEAHMDRGVLRVHLAKREEAKPRTIQVRVQEKS